MELTRCEWADFLSSCCFGSRTDLFYVNALNCSFFCASCARFQEAGGVRGCGRCEGERHSVDICMHHLIPLVVQLPLLLGARSQCLQINV